MNMDIGIVNRALLDTGRKLLSEEDIDGKSGPYELCRAYYIATFLEALSEVEWVGGRKRAKLARTGMPVVRDKRFRFAYDTPHDCARPIELQGNDYFIVEGRLILTDAPGAELLYVSNGKILRPIALASCGKPGDAAENEYFSAGPPGTGPDYTLYPGRPQDIAAPLPQDPPQLEDYPDYAAPEYEAKFYEYVEKKLAAKFAVKLSGQPQLHARLFQEALLIKHEAVDASRAGRAAKLKESPWWADDLGLEE